MDRPTPMEIDMTQRQGALLDEDKQRRREKRLCLFCRGLGQEPPWGPIYEVQTARCMTRSY